MTRIADLPVYLLMGGKSKRFGSDKASHLIEGKPWALNTAERLATLDKLRLVGRAKPSSAVLAPLPFVQDAKPAVGVLSGVLAAVQHCQESNGEGLLVLASCDLVRPNPDWLIPLWEAHGKENSLEVAAYVAADRWQPFPSIIHTRWLARIESCFTAKADYSLQSLLKSSEAKAIPWEGPAKGPPQANTPKELQDLLSI